MSGLSARPTRRLAIVTCMDCRIDLGAALGIERGEAHVIRNAGGVITDDVIRSLSISQRKLGTEEIMLIHHTQCGMEGLDAEAFSAELEADAGSAPSFAIQSFANVDDDVRASLERVRASAFIPHRGAVRGFVYDVETDALREVQLDPDGREPR